MANKTAPLLIIEKGFSDVSVVVLDEIPHVLGQIATAGTSLDNPYVSRRHAGIEQVGERYQIRDLRSTNADQPLPSPVKCLPIPVKSEAPRRPIIPHSSEEKAGMGQIFP